MPLFSVSALHRQFVRYKRFGRFKRLLDHRIPAARGPFPRVIHLYWEQGFAAAPEIVARSVASWQAMNPGWEVRLWSGRPFNAFTVPADITITWYSDLLRLMLLRDHGGVWADATTICRVPLDHWLPLVMSHCDFFAFSSPGSDRRIANWFLVARPGSLIIKEWLAACGRFWREQHGVNRVYHWHQYTFEWLLRTAPAFARAWSETPRISASPSFPDWQGESAAWVIKYTHKPAARDYAATLRFLAEAAPEPTGHPPAAPL